MASSPRALFLSHGGGPLPLLGDARHTEMISCLEKIAADIPRPDAMVVVSAHWEAPTATITAGAHPPLIYDYYGFPPESYQIRYPCPGEPALAREIHRTLESRCIEARLDETRGFDHGLFIPLKIMYPDGDIPCVQLSLVDNLDPGLHIDIGTALESLAEKNVLVVGSGFSFHNLKAFFSDDSHTGAKANEGFEAWLGNVCTDTGLTERERREQLTRWSEAPGARFCHPREEHLLPLHVCYGVAQSPCSQRYDLTIMDKKASMYLW